jgi:hypothetical protein
MSTQYHCHDLGRRQEIRKRKDNNQKTLNGIDYLEVAPDQKSLNVYFVLHLPGQTDAVPEPPAPPLTKENFVIQGGVRVTGLRVTDIAKTENNVVTLAVSGRGDFSTYKLRLVSAPDEPGPPKDFDPQLSEIDFSFKVECPSQFDCQAKVMCPPVTLPEPDIDYLVKDYASFRRLILDRLSAIMPDWRERNPVDLGITLVELLAYIGDYLSYRQDAIATEPYLGTARRRISIRRHARLLDYRMHDGCNARAWVCLSVNQNVERSAKDLPAPVPTQAKFLTVADPPPTDPKEYAAWLRAQPVFEPMHEVHGLYKSHNEIHFYTWSDKQCCLPKGATRATLCDDSQDPLHLQPGDVLVFEEVLGATSGKPADLDPCHRHAVRLTEAACTTDPLFPDPHDPHDPTKRLPVVNVQWAAEDALPFPLCLSALVKKEETSNDELAKISVARGNVVLVGHGLTIENELLVPEKAPEHVPYRPKLAQGPLTFQTPIDTKQSPSATATLRCDPRNALPCIELLLQPADGGDPWLPRPDLLASGKDRDEFVVEMESDGVAHLRFGDGTLGREPNPGAVFRATYRIGNGPAGNIGAETIKQVLDASDAIQQVRNPLSAQGGTAPESLEHVRQYAPQAFRRQERAVTEADYAEVAERLPGVQKAAARFRWSGSWYTVFVAVDRAGGLDVDKEFKQRVRRHLEKYRLAGYDVEIQGAEYLPLDVVITVCVKSGYFRACVKETLLDTFSSRDMADGSRGFFHPDDHTFGQPVYLSAVYERAMSVAGVGSVNITRFQRWGKPAERELEDAVLKPDRFQIIRLDNDRNFPENGRLEFMMEGGL